MLSLRHFILVTTIFKWLIILLGWYFIVKFCYLSYDYAMVNQSFFIQGDTQQEVSKHLMGVLDKNMDSAKHILTYYLTDILLTYVVKIAIVFFVLFLYKRILVPNSMIASWHENGEINPVLGRRLVSWLRWQTHFRLQELLHCYRISNIEKGYVAYHSSRKLAGLFKSFDYDYEEDTPKK